MSNIAQILDALSKLTEGELAVLGKVLTALKTDIENANTQATLAVNWSQYSLKTQRNTSLPPGITEPNVQLVDNYPIIFGNANDTSIPARSTTFAFGAKAFLGYENDAQGTPYLDTDYVGNTAHDLSEIEVVNYRTLMRALTSHDVSLSDTYIAKAGDTTPTGSEHQFGKVFFRGLSEKVYYGTTSADPTKEIAVQNDLTNLHTTINGEVSSAISTEATTLEAEIAGKVSKSGDVITGPLLVETPSLDPNGVVRNADLAGLGLDTGSGSGTHTIFDIPGTYTWNSGYNKYIELIMNGGGAGYNTSSSGIGGGGGGALKVKIAVIPHTDYTVVVADGVGANTDGLNSTFSGPIGNESLSSDITFVAEGGKTLGSGGSAGFDSTLLGNYRITDYIPHSALVSITITTDDPGIHLHPVSSNLAVIHPYGFSIGISDLFLTQGGDGNAAGITGDVINHSVAWFTGGTGIGGGASPMGFGSNESATINPGIGGGLGYNATTNSGKGIVIINSYF